MFPAPSEAVHTTIVEPTGNTEPDPGLQTGPTVTAMLSVATACGYATVIPSPAVIDTAISPGTEIDGGSVSLLV